MVYLMTMHYSGALQLQVQYQPHGSLSITPEGITPDIRHHWLVQSFNTQYLNNHPATNDPGSYHLVLVRAGLQLA